jgi:hypothetical protein
VGLVDVVRDERFDVARMKRVQIDRVLYGNAHSQRTQQTSNRINDPALSDGCAGAERERSRVGWAPRGVVH